ncbi:MAG: SMP-30/gluconolactonase/LRE family protein [Ancalomicrobiaceae bacterium]|nr:SMP-30/gluconolactonase/LRE family protein [Ancalomicrobiaceae bacterium]
MWQISQSYPDPAIEILDERFRRYVLGNAAVERLATGMRWAEGPVWFGDSRQLIWSDIPNNRLMKWDEETGSVSVFRQPSLFANGNTRDRVGRLVTCEHGGRRVTRTEYDGRVIVLADRYDGKRLNSPNDVVVKSDGSIWFTDPPFGILSHYEGGKAAAELPTNLYRLDSESGELMVVSDAIVRPNGLCFSPDESRFYVVESGSSPERILMFDVTAGGRGIAAGTVFAGTGAGNPDGIRCDVEGNLWAGWGGVEGTNGVLVFSDDGTPIGRIVLPERCANLCFGGVARNRLFMAASQSIYSLYVNIEGPVLV